jgi:hypothetical protein
MKESIKANSSHSHQPPPSKATKVNPIKQIEEIQEAKLPGPQVIVMSLASFTAIVTT